MNPPLGCFSASTGSLGTPVLLKASDLNASMSRRRPGTALGELGWVGWGWLGVHSHPCILELPHCPASLACRQGPGSGGAWEPDGPAALRLHGRLPLERGLRLLPPQRRVRARLRRPAPGYGVCFPRHPLSPSLAITWRPKQVLRRLPCVMHAPGSQEALEELEGPQRAEPQVWF